MSGAPGYWMGRDCGDETDDLHRDGTAYVEPTPEVADACCPHCDQGVLVRLPECLKCDVCGTVTLP